jgi:hypothetical protein
MVLAEQQKRLGQFRRTLRKQDQELFDELFERARLPRTDGIDLHLCADRNAQGGKTSASER